MARKTKGIRRRGKRYEMQFSHAGRRYSVSGGSADEVKQRAAEKLRALEKGATAGGALLTLDGYFHTWLQEKALRVKGSTVHNYRELYYCHISPALGKKELWTISRQDVKNFMMVVLRQARENGRDGIAASNNARLLLGMILKTAAADEIIARNVAAGVPFLRKTTRPARETIHRELTETEISIFFTAARRCHYYNAYRFMLYSGVRVGECLALEWRDIDGPAALVHINRTMTKTAGGVVVLGDSPKTKTSRRVIPINAPMGEVLEMQRPAGKVFSMMAPVFPNTRGEHATTDNARQCMMGIIARYNSHVSGGAVLVPFGIHAFRDTFASRAIRAGMAPNTLKEILGHASLAMTMDLYAHVSVDDKKRAMELLARCNG